ncbi:MAG: ATP-binding protein [Acidobacteria bacterium]|nr:ATP-binding protein [Acidobacteriota bacterium]
MLSALSKDWIVRLTALVWVAVVAQYFVPGVSRAWLEAFGERYWLLPTLIPVIVAAWVGVPSVPDATERRFWVILGVGFACWFVVSLPTVFVENERWSLSLDLLADIGYLLFYIFFVLAIELRPHEHHTGSHGDKEQQLRTAGLTLLGFFLLVYFALVPAMYNLPAYDSAMPSFYMYILLDLVILGRLLWMRRETWSVRWSLVYAWLAAGVLAMTAGDVVEALSYADEAFNLPVILTVTPGTLVDHLWTLPGVVFVLAIRARHVPFPAEQRVLNEPAAARHSLRAGHILMLSAFVLPFLHYALFAAGLFTEINSHDMREVISMASMVVLGGMALAAYRALEREHDAMAATELHLQNELSVARKMDAVARLAGSVAHDFNNLVQVVRGRAEIISQQIDADNPLHEDVRQIRSAATRAADLASQLMTFGRKQQARLTAVSLHELITRAESLLKPLLDDRTRLVVQLRASADVVLIDPLQFERIILNLATNARDAMPKGGVITIETSTPAARPYAAPTAPRVMLRISDSGTGMDAETMTHIFEPFFTTKTERGAGLGLAIVHGLVQQFGGTIGVESQLGRGTTFTITLPVTSDGAVPQAALPGPPAPEATPAAILMVEGDTTNRQLLRRLLSDLGRPVLATTTSAEALLIAGRYTSPIELVVIDVTIDGGRTLAQRLRETRADLRVLLLAQDQPVDLVAGDELLREPFELTEVLAAARRLL